MRGSETQVRSKTGSQRLKGDPDNRAVRYRRHTRQHRIHEPKEIEKDLESVQRGSLEVGWCWLGGPVSRRIRSSPACSAGPVPHPA